MSLVLSDAEVEALDADMVRVGVFFRLATTPILRLWLGVGKCRVGISAHDPDGAVYSGLGELLDVPQVNQLINGVAERVDFHVSGVTAALVRAASIEADDVRGAECALGVGIFDTSWQLLGAPKWVFLGYADVVLLSQTSSASPDGGGAVITRSITLSVGSLFTGRRRRPFSYLTDQDQQGRHPGDRFCERTVLYSNQIEKRWPVPT